jgi:rod shape-determining protein MreC
MRIPPSLLLAVGRFLLFILLEAACIYMVCNNGLVQRYRLIGELREIQGFFWERVAAINEYSSLKKANGILAAQNTLLMQELYKQKEITGHIAADTLSAPFSFIQAKVIKNTLNTPHNYLIIDKGSKDGVEEDMGVITPNGVVGITRGVSENYSYVLSFLNLNQQVSAKIGSTSAFGPLSWDMESEGKAVLNEIPQHLQVQQQDTVYTSGFSYFYPPDIPLGTVIGSKVVNGVHLRVDVQLLQDFRSLNYVMVVKNNNRKEIEKLVQEAK